MLSLAGVRSPRPWQVEMWLALGVDADLADVDDPDEGETPLLRAAANNRAAVMELLLQHGADAMHTNSEGKTALMTAASFGHVRAMRILFLYPPYSATVPTSEMVAMDSSPRKPEDAQDRLGDASGGCDGVASFTVCISDADNARSYKNRHFDLHFHEQLQERPRWRGRHTWARSTRYGNCWIGASTWNCQTAMVIIEQNSI